MPISWSRDAFDDLEAIYVYLKQYDPRAAVRMLNAIRSKALLLEQFPELGPLDSGTRRLNVASTPYIIVYELKIGGISVLRVFDTRQDWRHRIDDA